MADNIDNAAERAADTARAQVADMQAQLRSRSLGDYLSFRAMVTPVLIQAIFWIGVVLVVLSGLGALFGGAVLSGLGLILLGPLFIRIYCEIFIVLFKINDGVQALNRRGGL